MSSADISAQPRVMGHPAGLFTLFFAEMWERFSYYGMRALLVLYMIKGFLGYGDSQAYSVYGAYTALVYMTPFIGGMLADKILGQRLAVIIGGLLMAAGHLLMTIESDIPFFLALALIITGNGFFKPNISTTVGTLYAQGDNKRDDGFNIFYTGINLGAAMSPLLCGYVGETYGWHLGFGLATIGMLVGLAVFVMPNRLSAIVVLLGAAASALGLLVFRPDNAASVAINVFVAICLMIAAVISSLALAKGGLPAWAGNRPEGMDGRHDWKIYLGIAIAIPVFAMLVSGFSPFTQPPTDAEGNVIPPPTKQERLAERIELLEKFEVKQEIIDIVRQEGVSGDAQVRGKPYQFIEEETIEEWVKNLPGVVDEIAKTFLSEVSKPAGLVLTILGILAFGYLILETVRLPKIPRERMIAALVLIFFQMLFFAFFEQAGSSMNNFTDRNIDRVAEQSSVEQTQVGTTIRLEPTQAQLGFHRGEEVFTLTDLDELRKIVKEYDMVDAIDISWPVDESNVGMGLATRLDEMPTTVFQSFNAIFILVFALAFNWLWAQLRRLSIEPSAPLKFGFGLIQLGLGFFAFWMGAQAANEQGMVAMRWLTIGILFHTTGELCLSPVGLSTMTKLSPKALVSTLMGSWFLATAFSQYLAGVISGFTSVESTSGAAFPPPSETVNLYGDVFYKIAVAAVICGLVCAVMSPLLKYWMHQDKFDE
ncbi:MAG: oligopeptide:H+ symporter [Planctomycetales bacterium]|nr:oligopeptide:H+ symporter [Planctomycetales bacterium]